MKLAHRSMRRLLTVVLAACVAVSPLVPAGAAPPAESPAGDSALPVDPAVQSGRLSNGVSWFVRANGRPEARAELRLVVGAGSVDEDEDQRGLAHFVEHMLFNGTERYAGNDLISYFESIGARFGADLNAYTSFDETVYMLTVPTDREGLLEEGVHILGQFAHAATMDGAEIEKERGVVLDEWRGRLGAGKRVSDLQLPVLLKGSRYAERLPIGDPDIIRTGTPDAIRRYYHEWYRPERMAVVAVGDFRAEDMIAWIQAEFGPLEPTENLRARTDWDVPAHDDTLFTLADDAELRGSRVAVSRRRDQEAEASTYGAYREDLVGRLAGSMFSSRLAELSRSDDPPFFSAGRSSSTFGRLAEMSELWASVPEGGEADGLRAVLLEEKRALRHGFTETELQRAKDGMLAGIEAAWAERGKTPSGAYVAEYTRHFLNGEPYPGIDEEVEIWRREIPAITREECNAAFVESVGNRDGLVVAASRPTRDGMVGEAELKDVLREVAEAEPEPWVDMTIDAPLLEHPLPAGHVVSRTEREAIGVTELTLSNGVHVLLRPTDLDDDTILFDFVALGGLSMADDETFPSASSAGSIVSESGWGGRSVVELSRLLTGKVASSSPYFGARRHGISGSSTVADLPVALDLAVLQATEPNLDEAAVTRYFARLESALANRDADPRVRYQDRLTEINTRNHPRARPLTLDRLKEIDPERALAFYRDAFDDASDFTLFMVGNLDLDVVIPEIERTFGSLPDVPGPPSLWVDRKVLFADQTVRETVRAGREPRALTTITLDSYGGEDPFEWHRLRTATSILERRLRERLREEQGATYGVGVGYSWSLIGPARGTISVRFGSDPADAEAMGEEVFRAVRELQEQGPTAEELAKEQEIQTRELETSREQNGYWLGSLFAQWAIGRPLEEIDIRRQRIEDLDLEGLHRVFREYFSLDRSTWVDWLPAEGSAES
jgi:zinc protease